MPFEKADIELAKNDASYFRGLMIANNEHLHDCFHRIEKKFDGLESKVDKLEHWKVKVSTVAAGLAVIFTTLCKYLFDNK